jgi:hypothetical protein
VAKWCKGSLRGYSGFLVQQDVHQIDCGYCSCIIGSPSRPKPVASSWAATRQAGKLTYAPRVLVVQQTAIDWGHSCAILCNSRTVSSLLFLMPSRPADIELLIEIRKNSPACCSPIPTMCLERLPFLTITSCSVEPSLLLSKPQ